MEKQMLKYMMLGGLLLSVVAGFIPQMSYLVWVAVILGLVSGWFMTADVKTLLCVLILTTFAIGLSVIPAVGVILKDLLSNIGSFFGSMMVLPALKVLLKKAGVKAF